MFLALMEERNVTRAAARLGITQPALSNALARLRVTLNDPLFVRERYGMQPTPKATELAPAISGALARLDDLILGQRDFDPSKAERQIVMAGNQTDIERLVAIDRVLNARRHRRGNQDSLRGEIGRPPGGESA